MCRDIRRASGTPLRVPRRYNQTEIDQPRSGAASVVRMTKNVHSSNTVHGDVEQPGKCAKQGVQLPPAPGAVEIATSRAFAESLTDRIGHLETSVAWTCIYIPPVFVSSMTFSNTVAALIEALFTFMHRMNPQHQNLQLLE